MSCVFPLSSMTVVPNGAGGGGSFSGDVLTDVLVEVPPCRGCVSGGVTTGGKVTTTTCDGGTGGVGAVYDGVLFCVSFNGSVDGTSNVVSKPTM